MAQPIISFNNVSKRYPDGREALSNINFTVEAGEFVLLVFSCPRAQVSNDRAVSEREREREIYNCKLDKLLYQSVGPLRCGGGI